MRNGIVLALLVLAVACAAGRHDTTIIVSAAVSLSDALQQCGTAYAAAGGGAVQFNFGASNTLVRQMISGAPVDVLLSADEAQMDVADHAGALAPGTRVDLLANQLAIVATAAQAEHLKDPRMLADASVRRIAIGDPSAVPAGVYAREYLQRVGLWDAISPRLVPTSSVRAALAAVDNGAADAAIVYATDAAAARSARTAFVVPRDQGPRIVYPAAVASRTRDRAAAGRFLSFLQGPEATEIFRHYGFIPLAAHPS